MGAANVVSGIYSFAGGSASTTSGLNSFSFGEGNLVSSQNGVAFGKNNVSSGLRSAVFGSGTTASGSTHFVLGNKNITSDLFVVGNGTNGIASNIITTRQSGVTISQSGGTVPAVMTNGTNNVSALTVLSGTGSQPLGFKLPLIEIEASQAAGAQGPAGNGNWTTLTGSTGHANKGLMFWDGSNIRVYTGATFPFYATVATLGGGGSL